MQDVYLLCLVLGALVLVVQIALDLFGAGHTTDAPVDLASSDGLDLLSVRTVSAGAMLFGAMGWWLRSRGLPGLLTVPVATMAGLAAAVGTAFVTRQMLKLESSGSLRLENAVGQAATVYLPIPARRQGVGRVQFKLQGRTVELRAVADESHIIPTGAAVIVVAVMDDDTVEVTPTPQLEGIDV